MLTRKLILFTLITSSMFMSLLNAQGRGISDYFAYKKQTYKGTTIPYRLFVPYNYDSSKKYPVILSLHGADENGSSNEAQITSSNHATYWADTSIQKEHPCFIIAPQCPMNRLWYESDTVNVRTIGHVLATAVSILDTLAIQYNIDKDRIYALGVSMGGVACWELADIFPGKFAAIVPIIGTVWNRMPGEQGYTFYDMDKFKTIPAWIISGTKDSTFPIKIYYEFVQELIGMGRKVVFPLSRLGVYSSSACL
jgi:predicted peptidase